jgi:23S rRNA maturation mini-RNase III
MSGSNKSKLRTMKRKRKTLKRKRKTMKFIHRYDSLTGLIRLLGILRLTNSNDHIKYSYDNRLRLVAPHQYSHKFRS